MSGKRINKKDLVDLVAEASGYHKYEVHDVMTAFLVVMKQQLELGNQMHFEKLFKLHIERPKRKNIYDPAAYGLYLSPAHPRLKFTPSRRYKDLLWTDYAGEVFIDHNDKEPDAN